MKKTFLLSILTLIGSFGLSLRLSAQGVGISPSGSPVDPSAMLDVSSNAQGTLISRMTTVERDNIASICSCTPAEGLMIFNTTTKCLEMYLGGSWSTISCPGHCTTPVAPLEIYGITGICPNITEHYYISSTGASSYEWSVPADASIISGQGTTDVYVTFGSASGSISVKARDYMCSSAPLSVPVNMGIPPSPAAGIHIATGTVITWKWNAVPGATGYKYNTTNDFNSATDNGTVRTFTQSGLSPNSNYQLYVWAYIDCGHSAETVLTMTTTAGCPNAWENRVVTGASPTGRFGHSAVWDSSNDRMLIFGGKSCTDDNTICLLNDIWSYNPSSNTWNQHSPPSGPSARRNHSAVWDTGNNRMLIFGGETGLVNSPTLLGDLWAYSPSSNTWTQLTPSGGPGLNSKHTAVWDTAHNRMLVFGGKRSNGNSTNEVWAYTPASNTWTQFSPANPPTPRYWHSASWDAATGRMIIAMGREDSGGSPNQVWAYSSSANTWTQLYTQGGPTAGYGLVTAWDNPNSRMLITGSSSYNSTLFSHTLAGWSQIFPNGGPPWPRWQASAVWNPVSNRMLVFGGREYLYVVNDNLLHNDIWEYCP